MLVPSPMRPSSLHSLLLGMELASWVPWCGPWLSQLSPQAFTSHHLSYSDILCYGRFVPHRGSHGWRPLSQWLSSLAPLSYQQNPSSSLSHRGSSKWPFSLDPPGMNHAPVTKALPSVPGIFPDDSQKSSSFGLEERERSMPLPFLTPTTRSLISLSWFSPYPAVCPPCGWWVKNFF